MRSFKLILWFVATLVVLLSLGHFWPEEDLNPDIRATRSDATSKGADPKNLYFALFGFNAMADQDFFLAGRKVVQELASGGSPKRLNAIYLSPDDFPELCALRDQDCSADVYIARIPDTDRLVQKNQQLYNRYLRLHEITDFRSLLISEIPAFVSRIQRLFQLRVMADFMAGQQTIAWDSLHAEMAFHRRWLAASDSIVSKLVAAFYLDSDLRLYSTLLDLSMQFGTIESLPDWVPARLSKPEQSYVNTISFESSSYHPEQLVELVLADWPSRGLHGFGSIKKPWMLKLLPLKHNNTVNRLSAHLAQFADFSELSAKEFHARSADMLWNGSSPWQWLINGTGALVLANASDMSAYVYRIHNLNANLMLLQVKKKLVQGRIGERDVVDYLAGTVNEYGNPYDGTTVIYHNGFLSYQDPTNDQAFPVKLAYRQPTVERYESDDKNPGEHNAAD